jgi:hypothetical protein
MLRLLIDQGLEMFVRLTVRERDHPDKLGRLLADYAPDPIKLCHCFQLTRITFILVTPDSPFEERKRS